MKTFTDRYQKIVRRVKGLNPKFALQHVVATLKPRLFVDNMCRRPPKTMEELRERAAKDIRVEEMWEFRKRQNQEAVGKRKRGGNRVVRVRSREV